MKLIVIIFSATLITGCKHGTPKSYFRSWDLISASTNSKGFTDTVENGFTSLNLRNKSDTNFFKSSCFNVPLNVWVKEGHSSNYYKVLVRQKVLFKKQEVNLVKLTSAIDTNREDHEVSFLVLEKSGIIYEANPSARQKFILKEMINIKTNQTLIDSNNVKSIYLPNTVPDIK